MLNKTKIQQLNTCIVLYIPEPLTPNQAIPAMERVRVYARS